MFQEALVVYIYAETPMHPGSGVMINTPVDLPIQRERHTVFPMIQGSSMKGVLRSSASGMIRKGEQVFSDDEIIKFFGPEKGDEGAGNVSVSDARVLAFPVRTLSGVFGWITCPLVLDRLKRDLKHANFVMNWIVPEISHGKAMVADDSNVKVNGSVYIEEIKLNSAPPDENYSEIVKTITNVIPVGIEYDYIRNKMKKDLVIVDDEVFREIALLTTEVVARIKISEDKGIVERGALWYEEYLPTDTLLYSLILVSRRVKADDVRKKLLEFDGSIVQIGGNETVGRGFARLRMVVSNDKKS